ncbi:MAG TPA: hypothetical protein PKC72_14280 [Chitinophagaceae bacterium]|nr:hypothetical protein [Chitinophagaceae bacterium]
MSLGQGYWKKVFLICLGIFAGTAFCMKWMENDLVSNGEKFTIIGLEITYSKEKLLSVILGLDDKVKTILRYHLSFDFAFMIGAYGSIASLSMVAASHYNRKKTIRNLLVSLAIMQAVAWLCDIIENVSLLRWVKTGSIGNEFNFYHPVVYTKWILALMGVLISIFFLIFKKRNPVEAKTEF